MLGKGHKMERAHLNRVGTGTLNILKKGCLHRMERFVCKKGRGLQYKEKTGLGCE